MTQTTTHAQGSIIEEVFLTPRVLDEASFDRFAGSLKALIRDAEATTVRLGKIDAQTCRLTDSATQTHAELQGRLQTAAKLVKLIDQRSAETTALLDAADARMARLDSMVLDIDRIIADKTAAVQARMDDLASAVIARIEAATERLKEAEQSAAGFANRIVSTKADLDRQLRSVETRVQAAEAGAELIIKRLTNRHADLIERLSKAAGDGLTAFDAREAKLAGAVDACMDDMIARVDARAHELARRIELQAAELLAQLDARSDAINDQLQSLQVSAERAASEPNAARPTVRPLEAPIDAARFPQGTSIIGPATGAEGAD